MQTEDVNINTITNKSSWFEQLRNWRQEHISPRQFTLALSFVVGFLVSVAAFVLHFLIHQIQTLLTSGFNTSTFNWLYLVFPVVGIYLTSLFVKYVVKDNISHGITRILYAISSKRSHLKAHNTWSSVIASAITIGFGGSVGAEAPIVLTGSAIGSNLGQLFKTDNKTLMLMVGCGAAAAIAGIFKAPIAGLVFTLEVLMFDLTMASLLPILISTVTATCFSYLFTGTAPLFTFQMESEWLLERVPATILLGIACGLLSLYFIRVMNFCESGYAKLANHRYWRLLIGGLVLSSLIFLFPSLYGEGYTGLDILINGKTEADWNVIMNNSLFAGNGDLLVIYIGLVVITKVFATSSTNGAGGCGGTFAPSLFIGGFGGFLFARLWNMHQIGVYIPEKNFTLYGMAGVMAGVMHAPLTGIFLIAELTGGYQLFIPLMIVSICAYLTISIFEKHSIYGMRLAREGKLITHHTDHAVLTLMSLDSVIEKDYESVGPDMEMGKMLHVFSGSRLSYLPVLDSSGKLLGIIDIRKIRHIMFRTELYHRFRVSQLMHEPQATLGVNESMDQVMNKFEETNADVLPVVDLDNHFVGYVTRTHIYTVYRQMVADMSEE